MSDQFRVLRPLCVPLDGEWLHGSGRYEDILEQVRHGISRRDAKTGKPMPIGDASR